MNCCLYMNTTKITCRENIRICSVAISHDILSTGEKARSTFIKCPSSSICVSVIDWYTARHDITYEQIDEHYMNQFEEIQWNIPLELRTFHLLENHEAMHHRFFKNHALWKATYCFYYPPDGIFSLVLYHYDI